MTRADVVTQCGYKLFSSSTAIIDFREAHDILIFSDAIYTHTHTRLTPLFPGLPGWAGTRKVKPIWILLKQETVSGSGSWAICKSAPCSRQITMPAPHRSVFYRPDALPATQPTASKHWREISDAIIAYKNIFQITGVSVGSLLSALLCAGSVCCQTVSACHSFDTLRSAIKTHASSLTDCKPTAGYKVFTSFPKQISVTYSNQLSN